MGSGASGKWEASITCAHIQCLMAASSLGWHFRAGICPCSTRRNWPSPRRDVIPGGEEIPGQEGSQPLGDGVRCWHETFHALAKAVPFLWDSFLS